ncbi:MAG: hypothetical protein M1826_003656 [Phylliscum demangeonii]|nr:MAG: hypothetical protein M1826_003656 [Phylliscum demangeonii]
MAAASSPLSFLASPAAAPSTSTSNEKTTDPVASSSSPTTSRWTTSRWTTSSRGITSITSINGLRSPPSAMWTPSRRTTGSPLISPLPAGSVSASASASASPSQPRSPPMPLSTAFMDQSRALLDQQRRIFDQERLLFDQERALWQTERQALYDRIQHLERDPAAPRSTSLLKPAADVERWNAGGRGAGPFPPLSPAETVEQLMRHNPALRSPLRPSPESKFWEGRSRTEGVVPSRVFDSPPPPPPPPPPSTATVLSPSQGQRERVASQPGFVTPSSATEGSGQRHRHQQHEPRLDGFEDTRVISAGIDISLVDEALDGITLKASALRGFLKVRSPPASASTLPSPEQSRRRRLNDRHHLTIPLPNAEEANLIQDAGHTPTAPTLSLSLTSLASLVEEGGEAGEHAQRDGKGEGTRKDNGMTTPGDNKENHPPDSEERRPTQAQAPHPPDQGGADASEIDPDPALHGPLTLQNDASADHRFLAELNSRLQHEAQRASPNAGSPDEVKISGGAAAADTSTTTTTATAVEEPLQHASPAPKSPVIHLGGGDVDGHGGKGILDEPEVKLRFKRSMNFGAAFGCGNLGRSLT